MSVLIDLVIKINLVIPVFQISKCRVLLTFGSICILWKNSKNSIQSISYRRKRCSRNWISITSYMRSKQLCSVWAQHHCFWSLNLFTIISFQSSAQLTTNFNTNNNNRIKTNCFEIVHAHWKQYIFLMILLEFSINKRVVLQTIASFNYLKNLSIEQWYWNNKRTHFHDELPIN